MPDYSDILDCTLAHLQKSAPGERLHITSMQLESASHTETSLREWAANKGLEIQAGPYGHYAGFWLKRLDPIKG